MKVRVNYAIELENLSDKIADLTKKASDLLSKDMILLESITKLLELDGQNSIAHSYKVVDQIRKNMATVDECLADANALAEGYIVNIINKKQVPPTPVESVPAQPKVSDKPPKGWDPIKKVYYDREVSSPPESTESE